MSKWDKIKEKILDGGSDANIRFDDLRGLLGHVGFAEETAGSHHIFRKAGVSEHINLQRDHDGTHAKRYQVRQVRKLLTWLESGGKDRWVSTK